MNCKDCMGAESVQCSLTGRTHQLHQVATVSLKLLMDRLIEFDEFDHYQIVVAPGMDPALVIACACAIDEELEEEHKERKRKKMEQEG